MTQAPPTADAKARARARVDARARDVAEALLAWRRDPARGTWEAVFNQLRDYEKAAKNAS